MRWLVTAGLILISSCNLADNQPSFTCSVYIDWAAPSTRIDGTILTEEEIDKYTIYINERKDTNSLHTIVTVLDVTDASKTDIRFDHLPKGRHYFYMTVTDKEGRVSAFSNVLPGNCNKGVGNKN